MSRIRSWMYRNCVVLQRARLWAVVGLAMASAALTGYQVAQARATLALAQQRDDHRAEIARLVEAHQGTVEALLARVEQVSESQAEQVGQTARSTRSMGAAAARIEAAAETTKRAAEEVREIVAPAPIPQPQPAEVPAWLDGP